MVNYDLPRIQDADLRNKIVLVRVDHNVSKKGVIKDTSRIDETIQTLFKVALRGGKLILMTHMGRPKNKITGKIDVSFNDSILPVVKYLRTQYNLSIRIPEWEQDGDDGIVIHKGSLEKLIGDLKKDKIDMIYLPNTRWLKGEQSKDSKREDLGKFFASLADVYVNDAFGSWQPHASTIEPAKYLPSFAGLLMQKEIVHLDRLFDPVRPFVGIVAGSKFDTKIKPLSALMERVDNLILGGVVYNAYLSVKYGFKVKGISDEDLVIAEKFVKAAESHPGKIVELPYIVESDILDERIEGKYRTHNIHDLKRGTELNYILDVSSRNWEVPRVRECFANAEMFFVNAVMGFVPNFSEGTQGMYSLIAQNKEAIKMFGGGDTLQEFKRLNINIYNESLNNNTFYFFTGGGAVLNSIEAGSSVGMKPVQALIENRKRIVEEEK